VTPIHCMAVECPAAGLTKTCRDAVTVNDPAGDALSGPILCCMAAAPGHRLDAVTRRDAVLADAGTTKQGSRGSTCIEDCLVCDYYLHLSVPASIACEGPLSVCASHASLLSCPGICKQSLPACHGI